MSDKTVEKVATEIARIYSCLVGRSDEYSLGKKNALVLMADCVGCDIIVNNRTVILRTFDGSFQICA